MTVVAPPPTRPAPRRKPQSDDRPPTRVLSLFGGSLGLMAAVALAASHHVA